MCVCVYLYVNTKDQKLEENHDKISGVCVMMSEPKKVMEGLVISFPSIFPTKTHHQRTVDVVYFFEVIHMHYECQQEATGKYF